MLRFVDEALPEDEAEELPMSPMDELNVAFVEAVSRDDLASMQRLHSLGAEVNHHNAGAEETPLHFAACVLTGDARAAKWLVDHGANIEAQCAESMRPLHWAVRMGNVSVVKLLVERGCQLHPRSVRGITPYWFVRDDEKDAPDYPDERKIPQKDREAIRALLKDPPQTQLIAGLGEVVFGAYPPERKEQLQRDRERKEAQKKKRGSAPKNPAEFLKF